jgi:hypothetical protein
MKATSSIARFQGRWDVRIEIEPGSVPDRPAPYSSVAGAAYRPYLLALEFCTGAKQEDTCALRMENGSGFMKQAALSVTVSSITIYGNRLKKDGTPGQQVVDEKFYASSIRNGSVPEWVLAAAWDHLEALGCKS